MLTFPIDPLSTHIHTHKSTTMTSTKTILIKTLQTSARCRLTPKPVSITTAAKTPVTAITKRSFVLYNGFRADKFRMMNKEASGLTQATSTSEQDLTKFNDSTNNENPNDYYVPKSRQTVYSAHGGEIETAQPVNRMH